MRCATKRRLGPWCLRSLFRRWITRRATRRPSRPTSSSAGVPTVSGPAAGSGSRWPRSRVACRWMRLSAARSRCCARSSSTISPPWRAMPLEPHGCASASAEPWTAHACDVAALCAALSSPRPGHLAVYRWLPLRWEPGHESRERQSLETYLRAQGWTLISEQPIGDPVAGTLCIFRRLGADADSLGANLR